MSLPNFAGPLHYLRNLLHGQSFKTQLLRGGAGSAGIQALNRMLALAMGILLARTLGAEGYGIYAYALAIMSLLMVFAEAGVPRLLMREVAASHGRGEWGLLRGALIRSGQFVAFTSTGVSVISLVVLSWVADGLGSTVYYTTLLMLLVLPAAALVAAVTFAIRGLQRPVVGHAVDLLLRPSLVLLTAGSIFLGFPAAREPQYAMAAQLVAAVMTLLIGLWILARFLPQEARVELAQYRSRKWLKSIVSFALIGGAGIINSQVDVLMLGWFRSAEEVGIYRVAVQAAGLVAIGIHAVNTVIYPNFARLYAQGDMERLQRLATAAARIVLLAAMPIGIALVLYGGILAAFFFGEEFHASQAPIAILTIGQLVFALFGFVGPLLTMTTEEAYTARVLWATAFLNIIFNAILIPKFGVAGAAIASTLSLSAYATLLFLRARKVLRIDSSVLNVFVRSF